MTNRLSIIYVITRISRLGVLTLGGVLACTGDATMGPDSGQLIVNFDVESGTSGPASWFSGVSDTAATQPFQMEWSTEEAASGTRSLMIQLDTNSGQEFAYWSQQIVSGLPSARSVTLRAKVRPVLIGGGAAITIRGDGDDGTLMFHTSEFDTPIRGDHDWWTVTLSPVVVVPDVKAIHVFLVFLPNTVGRIYFDDITLTYGE